MRVLLALAAGLLLTPGPPAGAEAQHSAGAPAPGDVWVATVLAPTQARPAPSIHARWLTRVAPLTSWGTPQSLLVLRAANGPEGAPWLLVRLGFRPNGRQAWIYADDTVLRIDPWRIVVSRSARRMQVFLHDRLRREFSVVVGKPSTPTPAGLFAIAAKLLQPDPREFLGAWVIPLTAHSEVLKRFDGGDGQVALHGRGGKSLLDPLGSARSHGCVRMANSAIGWVAIHIPVGTPVLIR